MIAAPPTTAAPPANAVVLLLDSLNRHMLGAYGSARVRDAESRSPGAARAALRTPLCRIAAVHAGAPRAALRRPRLPLEAVGLDRTLGAADHRPPAPRRRGDEADLRPSASVRGRRRELPLRFHRLGLSARPRERRLADASRSELDGRAHRSTAATRPTTIRADGFAARPTSPVRAPWRPRRAGSRTKRRRIRASCSSSTSSIRTSRSTRPSRTRRCTIRTGAART